ncbi:flavin reductase (DIM6/NTAB) family NADH-FMN oxidoreductase RutF [Spinactinospora alkalitolerans]|uniref:Flavin reductase (DIM6/NTAB) family NADH-FMN oxidoreductase RutF n=1 Tax=Spinactinospora alkalitolerans TaxID=687207 RepID=A0A852TVA1_9ACTN|nr:flavin reductase family protein [Spinactinospora alkalitolerans]NYE45830.1 flavin reductase (DIM6/NTAB) family NADH-FMN oxidoreductase RutF [Spinactinospora alkalitolerans]
MSAAGAFATAEFTETMARFATGVTVVTVADDRDDIGSTVSAFASISAEPPIVMLSVTESSYLTEVIDRQGRFAVNVLGARHRAIAGRFAAEGRPSARLLLASEPHHRGAHTGALVLDTAVAALECSVTQRVEAGDHVVYLATVDALPAVGDRATGGPGAAASPLIRYAGRYRDLD